jgi:hypothetical protein
VKPCTFVLIHSRTRLYNYSMKKICSVDSCEKPHTAKGFCQAHYVRLKRTGKVGNHLLQARDQYDSCSIFGCYGIHIAKGLCQKHYTILNTYGLTVEQIKLLPNECQFCMSVEDLTIDHDHSCCDRKKNICGKCCRRVICRKCNTAIGMLGDNPDIYIKIAESLTKNPNPRLFT